MEVLGHRGQIRSGGPPENSLAAVDSALRDGAEGVEVDVRLGPGGEPVCAHDPIGAGATGHAPLAEVVSLVAGRGRLVLDLKHERGSPVRLVAAVRSVLERAGPRPAVLVSSFYPAVLREVARAQPQVRRALITRPGVPAVAALYRAVASGEHGVHPHFGAVLADHGVVERAARLGLAVCCWTVNRPVDARLLEVAGVAAVITDDVSALLGAARPTVGSR